MDHESLYYISAVAQTSAMLVVVLFVLYRFRHFPPSMGQRLLRLLLRLAALGLAAQLTSDFLQYFSDGRYSIGHSGALGPLINVILDMISRMSLPLLLMYIAYILSVQRSSTAISADTPESPRRSGES